MTSNLKGLAGKKQLTIDTCVLTQVTNGLCEPNSVRATEFLKKVYEDCHKIVVDKYECNILKEYKAHAKGYAKEWVIQILVRKKKLHKVDIRGCKIASKMKNDKFDHKFIDACFLSKDRLIITRDNGFYEAEVRFLIKKNGMRLLDTEEAMQLISGEIK